MSDSTQKCHIIPNRASNTSKVNQIPDFMILTSLKDVFSHCIQDIKHIEYLHIDKGPLEPNSISRIQRLSHN